MKQAQHSQVIFSLSVFIYPGIISQAEYSHECGYQFNKSVIFFSFFFFPAEWQIILRWSNCKSCEENKQKYGLKNNRARIRWDKMSFTDKLLLEWKGELNINKAESKSDVCLKCLCH